MQMTRRKTKRNQVPKGQRTSVATATQKSMTSKGRKILRELGAIAGTALVGNANLGRQAGDYFARLTGLGAYKVRNNSIMKNSQQAPVFNNGNDSVTIEHSEFITDVYSSTGWVTSSYVIDPTNSNTFPWLSGVSRNFDQYEFEGLVFTYKPTSGSAVASTNSALGTVIMATEYDVSKPLFANKAQMEAYEFATSTVTDCMMYHPVECNPREDIINARYVGSETITSEQFVTSNSSFSTFNLNNAQPESIADNLTTLGRLQLSTIGMQTNGNTMGELWVSYRVKLLKPRKPGLYSGYYHATSNGFYISNASPDGYEAFAHNYAIVADTMSSMRNVSLREAAGNVSELWLLGFPAGTALTIVLSLNKSGGASGTVSGGTITWTNLTQDYVMGLADPNQNYLSYSAIGGTLGLNYVFNVVIGNTSSFNAPILKIGAADTGTLTQATWDLFVFPREPVPNYVAPFVSSADSNILKQSEKLKKLEEQVSLLQSKLSAGLVLSLNE